MMPGTDVSAEYPSAIPQVPPNFHVETVGESRFVIPDRYSGLRPIGTGAQGYVV